MVLLIASVVTIGLFGVYAQSIERSHEEVLARRDREWESKLKKEIRDIVEDVKPVRRDAVQSQRSFEFALQNLYGEN